MKTATQRPFHAQLDRDELAMMICAMGDVVKVLADADRARKAKIYSRLGLRLTYYPVESRVLISQASGRRTIGDRFVSEGPQDSVAEMTRLAAHRWPSPRVARPVTGMRLTRGLAAPAAGPIGPCPPKRHSRETGLTAVQER